MPKLTNGTWVVVADGEKALLMRNLTDHQDPNFQVIAREEQPQEPENADRPGRMPDPGPNQMSALEATDWRTLARDRFATELSDILYEHAHRGDFQHVVIAAGPKVLGAIREALHPEVKARLVAEIDKDLTHHPRDRIETEVKAALDAMDD
ncbi:host attachment family protein [Pseudodonghicola xiamenensis]|uniref:Host attachment protein n=1 Tax=Pseudodonghicola xiamenensis TaxID=337702 RepID=A0A8J3MD63_9RHOB|nr:host attachment family protein [Pseudodonghicola xiamenensis]GHG96774.1 host attachment protein [Pseudodonghicola xiamenensis]